MTKNSSLPQGVFERRLSCNLFIYYFSLVRGISLDAGFFFWRHSADGTLSVMDVRSKQAKPVAQSEDQEDELLSIVAIKGWVSRDANFF